MLEATSPDLQTLTIKLRLRDRHAAELRRQARAVNFVWNYCNETAAKAWARDRIWLTGFKLSGLTAGSSVALGLHAHTIQLICQQYARSRDKAARGQIRWRSKRSLGWVPFNTEAVSFDGRSIKFRGERYEPMHLNPKLLARAKIGAGSFNEDGKGRWYVNLTVNVECESGNGLPAVGIDLGLKTLATLSDGGAVAMPSFYRRSEISIAAAQRAKKSRRAQAIYRNVANRRRDFLHQASAALTKKYGAIIIGNVAPSKLARTKMAKSVLDAGWSDFKRMLSYKAVMHGGRTIEVSERMTTQTCSECGSVPPSRPTGIAGLGIREWKCDDCGAVHDRDVNAARNILRVGLDTLAEGAPPIGGAAKLEALAL